MISTNTYMAKATEIMEVEKIFNLPANQINKEIKASDNGKDYILRLKNIVNEEVKPKEIEEIREVIVDTNDINKILEKYATFDYNGEFGSKKLNATEVVSIEVAGVDEKYWETLDVISKTLTLTSEQVENMGEDVTQLVINDRSYTLTSANFTPIEFKDNSPTLYKADTEYTAVIENKESKVNSYKAKIKYTGSINTEGVAEFTTVANYSVEEVKGNNLMPIVATTTGTGAFLVIWWFFIRSIHLYSGEKKLKGYRMKKDRIEIDITKEQEIYEDLNLVIKKRLAKRLHNTLVVITANGTEVKRLIINSSENEIRISL